VLSSPPVVLALVALAGCLPTSRVAPVTTPTGNNLSGKGLVLGVGVEITGFGSSLTENGQRRDDVTYGPSTKIPFLQLFSFSARESFTDHCDLGFQVNIGSLGGDVRCGLGDEHKTLAVATGATFRWWHGLIGRTELQAGVHKEGFVAFASSGITYATYRHAIALNEGTALEDLLTGPHEPYLRVAQHELAWSSALTLGFPTGKSDAPTIFMSVGVDAPFATSSPRFTCEGCARSFDDFDPGVRFGGMIGVAAVRD
jgi:hypothetical protein